MSEPVIVARLRPHESADDGWKVFLPRADHRQDGRYADEAWRYEGQHV